MLLSILFFFTNLTVFAQKDIANAIPITIEEALKFKTCNDALKLPPTYEVLQYEIAFSFKGEVFIVSPGLQGFTSSNISAMISSRKAGDRMTLCNVILKKGDRQIKLENKTYVFK